LGILLYFTWVRNGIVNYNAKNSLTSEISQQMPAVIEKFNKFSIDLTIDSKFYKHASNAIFSKWLQEDNNFDKISPIFINFIIKHYFGDSSKGKILFLKYILFDLFPMVRNSFISELKGVDVAPGSPKYEFIQYFQYITTQKKLILPESSKLPKLSANDLKNVWKQIENGNIDYYIKTAKKSENHEALISIAENCIKKGYTNFENLLKLRRSKQPFKMLIKYDERFSYFEQNIRYKLEKNNVTTEDIEKIIIQALKLKKPLPFSAAIFNYDDAIIQLLPYDIFLFVIDMHKIKNKYKMNTATAFMNNFVVPLAKKNHNKLIKSVCNLAPTLKEFDKEFVANYYLVDIDVESLIVKADPKAIPEGLQRIVVRDILDNGNLPKLLANQDMYISQVISSMPLEGLLFGVNIDSYIEKYLQKYKNQIKKVLKSENIPYKTLLDKSNLSKNVKKINDIILPIFQNEDKLPPLSKKDLNIALKTIANNSKLLIKIISDKPGEI
jgi:hypothetical protein